MLFQPICVQMVLIFFIARTWVRIKFKIKHSFISSFLFSSIIITFTVICLKSRLMPIYLFIIPYKCVHWHCHTLIIIIVSLFNNVLGQNSISYWSRICITVVLVNLITFFQKTLGPYNIIRLWYSIWSILLFKWCSIIIFFVCIACNFAPFCL